MNGSEFPLQLPPSDPPFIWDFGLTGFNQRTNQKAIRLEPQHEVAPLLANLQIDPLFLQTPEPIPDPELAAQKDVIHFRQAHPGLYVPTDVLQEALIYEKKIIKHESSTSDAYQGNLLATCTWSEYEHPILVYPKGPMLDILNVCPLYDLDPPINISKIKPPKRLGFTNVNSTIKHVEFSKKHYMGKHRPLLAVRTDYQIILFDLKKKKFHNEVRLKFKKMEHFQFNCRIFNFAFNPTLEKEISFVTEDGSVYLWEGIIDPTRIRVLASKDPIYQTWRQVEYGSDPRTLLLCSQHDVYALDFRGPTTEVKLLFNLYSFKGQLDSYEEGDNKVEQTICAVKRHPVNPFQFFLSTTHYIMVFDERAANDPLLTCAHNLDLPPQAFFTNTYEEKVLMLVTNYKSGEIQFWQFKSTNTVPVNVNNNNNNSLSNSSEIQEPPRAKKKRNLSEGLSNFLASIPTVSNPINWKNHFMSAPSQTPQLLHTPFKLNTYASSQDDNNFLHFFSTKTNQGLCGVLMMLADIERIDDDATQADPEFMMYRAKGGKALKIFHASVHGDIFFQNFSIQPLNNANIASPRKIVQKERNNLMSPIEKDISERNMAQLPEMNLKEHYTANLWGLFKHITEEDKIKEDPPKETTKHHSRIEKIMEKVMIFIKQPRTFAEIMKYVTNELNVKVSKQELIKELEQRVATMSPDEELEFQEHPAFEVIFKKSLVIMQSVKEQLIESNFSQNEDKMNKVAHWAENLQHDYGTVYCSIPFSRVKGDLDPLVPEEMQVEEDANKTVDNSESQSVNVQTKPVNKRNEMLTKLQDDWNAAQERFLNNDTSMNLTQHTQSQIEDIQRRLTFQTPRLGSTQLTPRPANQNSPTKRTAATPFTPLIASRRSVTSQQTPTQSAVSTPMANVETIELPSVASVARTNRRPAPKTLPTNRALNLSSAPSTPAPQVRMTPVMFSKEVRPSPVDNEEFSLTMPKRARTAVPQTPNTPSVSHFRVMLGPGSQPQTVIDNDDMFVGSQSSQDPFASQPQSQNYFGSIPSTPTVTASQQGGSTGSKKRKRTQGF